MITTLGTAVAALSLLGSVQGAAAYERWVEVVNGGNEAIWSLRISHIDDPQKGRRDLLGRYVIDPGSSMVSNPTTRRDTAGSTSSFFMKAMSRCLSGM